MTHDDWLLSGAGGPYDDAPDEGAFGVCSLCGAPLGADEIAVCTDCRLEHGGD